MILYSSPPDRNIQRTRIRLQHQLNSASQWFSKWRLGINTSKIITIAFTKRKMTNTQQLSLNGHTIPWSKSAKYLGIHFDKSLSFSTYIKEFVRKSTTIRGMFYPILNRRSPILLKTILRMYQMYVRSITVSQAQLEATDLSNQLVKTGGSSKYCSSNNNRLFLVRDNLTLRNSSRLLSLQELILKSVKSLFYKASSSSFNHRRNLGKTEATPITPEKPRLIDWTN